jgi:Fe-S-cluster containining protein
MSPCEDCHAGCCRSFAVPVSGADIMRIEYGLGLSFWDFVCRWEDPDGRIALNYAPHFFFDDEPETQFVISLMHHESEYFKETTRCRFLTEGAPDEEHSLGQARCGIYNFRPGACRVFPTKFDPASELAVIHGFPSLGLRTPSRS